MIDPPIEIDGPYDSDDLTHGPSTPLFLGDSLRDSTQTETEEQSIPGEEDSILTALLGQRDINLDGTINGQLLMGVERDFGDDPVDAIIEWIFEFESLALPGQGVGYIFVDDVRGMTLEPPTGILIEEAEWVYDSGQGTVGEWRITAHVGEGVQPVAQPRSTYISDQRDAQTTIDDDELVVENVGTIPLAEVQSRRYSRNIDINLSNIVHNTDIPVVGTLTTGVRRQFQLDCRISRHDVPDLKETSRELSNDLHGREVTFRDAFTEREFEGVVRESTVTWDAGVSGMFEANISIDMGVVTGTIPE